MIAEAARHYDCRNRKASRTDWGFKHHILNQLCGVPCNWVRELTCSRPCGDIGEAADPYVPTPPRLGFREEKSL